MPRLKAEDISKIFRLRGRWSWLAEDDEDFDDEVEPADPQHEPVAAAEVQALEDISFALCPGEALGVLGSAQAGKSTLLRILAGLTRPTTGTIRGSGRLVYMNGLRQPVHPNLSGRQNIELIVRLLEAGTSGTGRPWCDREELAKSIEAASQFCGLVRKLDQPVTQFAPHQFGRLTDALMLELKPDIFLFDGTFTAGDPIFCAEYVRRLKLLLSEGRMVVFASRRPRLFEGICGKILWLERGRVAAFGETSETINAWQQAAFEEGQMPPPEDGIPPVDGNVPVSPRITSGSATCEPATRPDRYDIHVATEDYFKNFAEEGDRTAFAPRMCRSPLAEWNQLIEERHRKKTEAFAARVRSRNDPDYCQPTVTRLDLPVRDYGRVIGVRTTDLAGHETFEVPPGETLALELLVQTDRPRVGFDVVIALSLTFLDATREQLLSPTNKLAIVRPPAPVSFAEPATYVLACQVDGRLTAAMASNYLVAADLRATFWDETIIPRHRPADEDVVRFQANWIVRADWSDNIPYGYYGASTMRTGVLCPEFNWRVDALHCKESCV